MIDSITWMLDLPIACSGPGGWFALRQNGEIILVCLAFGAGLTAAIAIGSVLRRRVGLLLPLAVVALLLTVFGSTIGGGADCGDLARVLGYIEVGCISALCAGQFLFWKRSRALEAATRGRPAWHSHDGLHDGSGSVQPDDAVTVTPAPLMTAATQPRAALVKDTQSWDLAAQSADRRDELLPPTNRWQLRLKLRTVKNGLTLIIGLVTGLLASLIVPTFLAPNRFHYDVAVADSLPYFLQYQKDYQKQMGHYAGSATALKGAQVIPSGHGFVSAFEVWQGNRDAQMADLYPCWNFRFRMLHGTESDPHAWHIRDDPEILAHWAITARRADPQVRAYYQLLLTETGEMFKHIEPPPGDPRFDTFLLDGLPDVLKTDGTPDPVKLQALGWTPVRRYYEMEDLEEP